MKYLFVGGIADGDIKELPPERNRLEIPHVRPFIPASSGKDMDSVRITDSYEKLKFGAVSFYYCYDQLSLEGALSKLLANYAPRLAKLAEASG